MQNSDLALTLLDYAGVATDPEPFGSVDLRPVLRGEPTAADPDRAVVLSPSLPWSGIRRGRYKYLGRRNPYFPARALFDLDQDPGETCNLAEHPDHVAAADELERLLDLELARTIPDFAQVPADGQASPRARLSARSPGSRERHPVVHVDRVQVCEPEKGIEPLTCSLRVSCSAD